MHKEVLREIRDAEERARAIENEARLEADGIIARAREDAGKKAQEIERAAGEEAERRSAGLVADAQAEAGRLREAGEVRIEAIRRSAGEKLDDAVRSAVEKLLE